MSSNQVEPPPPIVDPTRMDLTVEECEQAWAIRRAIEAIPELDNLSDFMYCHFAIIVGEDVEDAVQRAHHLQSFREEYRIMDTHTEGRKYLRRLLQLAPEYFLDWNFQEDSYSMALNMKGFEPRNALDTPDKESDWIVAYYYLQLCQCMDFETIRQGVIYRVEGSGYDWKKHLDVKLMRRLHDAYHASFPCRMTLYLYHNNVMINVFNSLCKKLYPKGLDIKVGCEAPAPLDEIFLQPTPEVANQRTLLKLENSLRRRYEMEKEFSLEAFTATIPQEEEEDYQLY